MADTICSLTEDASALNLLISEFFAYWQPESDEARYWVAQMIQAEWERRDLERRWAVNQGARERCVRELETLRAGRAEPSGSRQIHLVPLRRS